MQRSPCAGMAVAQGLKPCLRSFVVNVEGAVEKEGRYLMIVRGADVAHAPGALSFPGGKVEAADGPDDALESTLRREIREEVGVEVEDDMRYVESRPLRHRRRQAGRRRDLPLPLQVGRSVSRPGGGPGRPLDDPRADPPRRPSVVQAREDAQYRGRASLLVRRPLASRIRVRESPLPRREMPIFFTRLIEDASRPAECRPERSEGSGAAGGSAAAIEDARRRS